MAYFPCNVNSNLVHSKKGNFTLSTDYVSINCGFKPTHVTLKFVYNNYLMIYEYINNTVYYSYYVTGEQAMEIDLTTTNRLIITDNGFKFKFPYSSYAQSNCYYIAS